MVVVWGHVQEPFTAEDLGEVPSLCVCINLCTHSKILLLALINDQYNRPPMLGLHQRILEAGCLSLIAVLSCVSFSWISLTRNKAPLPASKQPSRGSCYCRRCCRIAVVMDKGLFFNQVYRKVIWLGTQLGLIDVECCGSKC